MGEEEVGYKVCLRCGKLMPAGAVFCNSCGADLAAPAAPGLQGAVDPAEFKGSMEAGAFQAAAAPPAILPGAPPPGRTPQPYAAAYHPYAAAPPYGAYPPLYRQRRTDNMAVVSIMCAIASFVMLPLFPAVAAIATGFVARERINKSGGMLEGNVLALAGILLGALNLLLCFAILILAVLAYGSA